MAVRAGAVRGGLGSACVGWDSSAWFERGWFTTAAYRRGHAGLGGGSGKVLIRWRRKDDLFRTALS